MFLDYRKRKTVDKKPKHKLTPEERCFLWYKRFLEEWKSKPSWNTVHEIYKGIFEENNYRISDTDVDEDEKIARRLAWGVFFTLHVMEYVKTQKKINGSVDFDVPSL